MTNALKISQLLNEDIEELINLVNSAYRGESSKKGWTTEADLLDGLRTNRALIQTQVQQPGAIILVARNELNRMVGSVSLQQLGLELHLGMLTVAPEIQAKGIGKQLLNAAENYAHQVNCSCIRMTVIDIRHELIDWYKRKGYQSTGETKPFPTNQQFGIPRQPLQFIVLEKKIQIVS